MDPRRGAPYSVDEDPLAYGEYHEEHRDPDEVLLEEGDFEGAAEGERGIVGDTYRKIRHRYQQQDQSSNVGSSRPSKGLGSFIFHKLHDAVNDIGSKLDPIVGTNVSTGAGAATNSHTYTGAEGIEYMHDSNRHRYGSFAAQRTGNDVKWYVDGCSYMWAVSRAIEQATTSIWILDWWLSPELYLRRPPSTNEPYRLDRMLLAAAQRGVKVNIIVYKEVTQALTRLGLAATFLSLEHVENENPLILPPLTVCSYHTKHALEGLHPNISVFRHPDHLPDAQTLQSSFLSSLQNLSLSAKKAATLPADALKAIYGMNEDVILYWAHHEKLCLVDGQTAFMGGLDLCYGRWDTNQHPIADCHPSNLDNIVFPGQDYNNARVMDFQDVSHWQNNKLNRKDSARMGWSDVSISLSGPTVEDLRAHFVERWNFIYDEKYDVRKDVRYSRLNSTQNIASTIPQLQPSYGQAQPAYDGQSSHQAQPYFRPPPNFNCSVQNDPEEHSARGRHHHLHSEEFGGLRDAMYERFEQGKQHLSHQGATHGQFQAAGVSAQIMRSCTKWSHGVPTEHSIANAYISVIENSRHFVYIENQFFITATSDAQKPVKNKIGAAIVARILRAARTGEKYKIIVVIPAIPGFAGDLKDDASLGTRAIMEFQYNSINRGGHSIMESVAKEGYNPSEYISFYNLRNYDRINVSGSMREAEQRSGVDYETARQRYDEAAELPTENAHEQYADRTRYQQYQQYQQATINVNRQQGLYTGQWDSVSECYMLGGRDIRTAPWKAGDYPEIKAFVSEELYVHSKVCITDDRVAIVGSANLNDRSQLGDHDSEIAIIIEDSNSMDSYMDGRPYQAARFAATLRRQLFRKHLGLLKPQNMERPDQNSEPIGVPNIYDYGSREDQAVVDPLSDRFLDHWNSQARTNSYAFGKIFHPVPHDDVRTWKDYDAFYEAFFHEADQEAEGKEGKKRPPKYNWGHVVEDNFSPGDQGTREVKDLLSTIRGTLVDMPLQFLIEEDIAKEGISLNAFTEEVYT